MRKIASIHRLESRERVNPRSAAFLDVGKASKWLAHYLIRLALGRGLYAAILTTCRLNQGFTLLFHRLPPSFHHDGALEALLLAPPLFIDSTSPRRCLPELPFFPMPHKSMFSLSAIE